MSQLRNHLRRMLVLLMTLTLLLGAVPAAKAADAGSQAEELEIVSSYPYTTTTKVKVNLRSGRSVRSTLLRHIPAGAEITVNAVKGSWAEVDYGKYSGYVMTEYIVLKKVEKVKITPTPTPVPTLSPEEDAGGYRILQKGDSGAEVVALQEALIELGFLKGTADGEFGAATEKAVIAFQQKNDYPATGIMDRDIQAFLYSDTVKNAAGEKVNVKTLSPAEDVSMRRGNKGSAVKALQQRLQELGYLKKAPSGTYDSDTIGAVRSFQKKNGIKADGTADAATRRAIYAVSAIPANATATPAVTATPTPTPTMAVPEGTLKSGDQGADVKTVQSRLKELGYYRSVIDGKFGRDTVNALKTFQTAHGLNADGIAGGETIAVLFSTGALYKGTTPTPLPTETPAPSAAPTSAVTWTTLRKNDKGDSVAQLQEALIQLGYLTGKADGNYGDKTVAAVKAFQKANNLKVDGQAGEETQKLLYGGTAAAAATATPKPTATPKATPTATPASDGVLRKGDKGSEVKALQQKLIQLGYLTGKADGVYGIKTMEAVKAYQKAQKLKADGVAGAKTLGSLNLSGSSVSATPTPAPTAVPLTVSKPTAASVLYANWYDKVKAIARKYPYATVYDLATGISWQIHIFSLGAHADYEPVTASDTANLLRAFGGNTWNPRAVWVRFSDGSVYIGSTHSMPHDVQHNRDNNFAGHSCLHFPRTQAQVTAIGPYATKHQEIIDAGWATTQKLKYSEKPMKKSRIISGFCC